MVAEVAALLKGVETGLLPDVAECVGLDPASLARKKRVLVEALFRLLVVRALSVCPQNAVVIVLLCTSGRCSRESCLARA